MTSHEISSLRLKLDLSQGQLAQLVGVHVITVSKWERGVSKPTPFQLGLLHVFNDSAQHGIVTGRLKEFLILRGPHAALALLLRPLISPERP